MNFSDEGAGVTTMDRVDRREIVQRRKEERRSGGRQLGDSMLVTDGITWLGSQAVDRRLRIRRSSDRASIANRLVQTGFLEGEAKPASAGPFDACSLDLDSVLRLMLLQSPLSIIIVDEGGSIRVWNPSAERMFGLAQDTVLGKRPPTPMQAEHEILRLLRDNPTTGQTGTKFSWRRRDGTILEIYLWSVPLVNGEGASVGTMGLAADFSLRGDLDEQLRQSYKMDAIQRLASGMAHNINNPLGIIIGFSQLLLADLDPNDARVEKVDHIQTAARRVAELVGQLQTFSDNQPDDAVVDLNAVISHISPGLRDRLGERIDLITLLGDEIGLIHGDLRQLERLLVVLADNAMAAISGTGRLLIQTSNTRITDEYAQQNVGVIAGPHVMMSVTDTGAGMDERTQSRCFEPFYTTRPQGEGVGMGLAVLYGIVKQHKAHILIRSARETGTKISIYFPQIGIANRRLPRALQAS
jgi:two-component system cell cycle sensor histidine kinase/response regulator CckA